MFKNFVKTDTKNNIKKPSFVAFLLLFVAVVVCLSCYFKFSETEKSKRTIYNVTIYESKEELALQLEKTKSIYVKELDTYNKLNQSGKNSYMIKEKKYQVDELAKTIKTLELLNDKDLAFEEVVQYRNTYKNNTAGFVVSFIIVGATMAQLFFVFKSSMLVPSELKYGQSRFTLIMSVGRINYVFYRWISIVIVAELSLLVITLLSISISSLFFGIKSSFVIFSTINQSFVLSSVSGALLQFVFSSITLISMITISFAVSLLINSQINSLIVSNILCFSGIAFDFIQKFFENIILFNFLLPNTLVIEKIYYNSLSNSLLMSFAVLIISLFALTLFSIIKFKNQDIKE